MYNENTKVEQAVLTKANNILFNWYKKFREISIEIDPLVVARFGEGDSYFSEIEFCFWNKNNIIDIFSLIIFMHNKQVIQLDEVEDDLLKEFEGIYNRLL